MKKSSQEKRKAGIDNVTEIVICDTLEERTLRSWQVQRKTRYLFTMKRWCVWYS